MTTPAAWPDPMPAKTDMATASAARTLSPLMVAPGLVAEGDGTCWMTAAGEPMGSVEVSLEVSSPPAATDREQHSPLERWASKNNALDGMRWQMNPGTSDTVQEVWWSVHYLNWLPNKAAFFCIIVTGQSLWARRSCFSCATSFLRWVTSFWQQHKKKYST